MMCKARFSDGGKLVLIVAAIMLGLIMANPAMAGDKLDCAKKEAKTVVHAAAVGLAALIKDLPDAQERIKLIQRYIDPIRFYPDNSGYFYAYDLNCVNIAHATQKDLVGKSLKDYKDSKGNYVIRLLAEKSKQGGGFVEYWWIKPGVKGEHAKLGYVEPIPGTDYFIGTGVYLD